jgi:eukaryotic-like serine/threonine-protein kinase
MSNESGVVGRRRATLTNVTGSTDVGMPFAAVPSPWQTGTHFSRYEIDSRLAAGGMAEVWRAKIKGVRGFEKRIVIKTMLPHLAGSPELVQMFINEATLAAGLSHPNVAHVFDFGQIEGRYFIAMEYVSGVTLRFAHKRMVARGERLPIAATLHVVIDVCEALQSVHDSADSKGALGLVHRDISPDNIIISTSGTAKLIDFGAARATTRTPPPSVFVGKYRYAAPERIRGVSEDNRSDLYSAGVILYECLTGGRPFDGAEADVIAAVKSGRVCDPRARVPALPAGVAEIVMKAMAHDPEARFGTARELGSALAACLAELGASSKERDVTASLATLIEAPAETKPSTPVETEAVPEPIGGPREPAADADMALCEVEILEASGPLHVALGPPPLPAFPSRAWAAVPPLLPPRPPATGAPAPRARPPGIVFDRGIAAAPDASAAGSRRRRGTPKPAAAASPRAPLELALELFDRGIELRVAGRYGEALDVWERAFALAPENRVYESNVSRLREQLGALRRAERQLADWRAGEDVRP